MLMEEHTAHYNKDIMIVRKNRILMVYCIVIWRDILYIFHPVHIDHSMIFHSLYRTVFQCSDRGQRQWQVRVINANIQRGSKYIHTYMLMPTLPSLIPIHIPIGRPRSTSPDVNVHVRGWEIRQEVDGEDGFCSGNPPLFLKQQSKFKTKISR